MDYIWLAFVLFLILNTVVYSFQRTTLEIARSKGGNIRETQLQMTPRWVGILGWISTLGIWGSVLLIIFMKVWWVGLLAGAFVLIFQAIVPIPRSLFYKFIKN